mgnify:CR=1 FL=1
MKLRERKITVRLTDAERDHLLAQAELAGLKIEPFVRNVILGMQMQPRPKEEWAELLRQTSGIANNINQITKRANSGELVTEETLRLIADMQVQIWNKLKSF